MLKNWVVVNEQDWVEWMHSVKHTLTVDGDGSALHEECLHKWQRYLENSAVMHKLFMCQTADWETIQLQSAC